MGAEWLSYLVSEMGDHLVKHGDGVKDIAFTVQDCDFLVQVCSQFLSCAIPSFGKYIQVNAMFLITS